MSLLQILMITPIIYHFLNYSDTIIFMKALKIIIQVLASLLISLALAEIVLKHFNIRPVRKSSWDFITNDPSSLKFFSLDPDRIYRINPNTTVEGPSDYVTDSFGFRTNPSHLGKSPSPKRIIMVGDSTTFGHGVEENKTFPFIVEQQLNNQYKDVWVDNAGTPGYGLDQEYLYITNELLPKYKPKYLIWNVNLNDMYDSNNECLFRKTSNGYNQISGRFNTLYIKGRYLLPFYKTLPTNLQTSRVAELLLNSIPEPFTVGCTKSNIVEEKEFVNKASFLFSHANSLAKAYNTVLFINIVLIQFSFDWNSNEFNNLAEQRGWSLYERNLFIKAAQNANVRIFDSNALVYDYDSTSFSNILGVSSNSAQSNLFMDEPDVAIGWRHLNIEGNLLMGESFATELAKLDL